MHLKELLGEPLERRRRPPGAPESQRERLLLSGAPFIRCKRKHSFLSTLLSTYRATECDSRIGHKREELLAWGLTSIGCEEGGLGLWVTLVTVPGTRSPVTGGLLCYLINFVCVHGHVHGCVNECEHVVCMDVCVCVFTCACVCGMGHPLKH